MRAVECPHVDGATHDVVATGRVPRPRRAQRRAVGNDTSTDANDAISVRPGVNLWKGGRKSTYYV
jgi:hypothetical protein